MGDTYPEAGDQTRHVMIIYLVHTYSLGFALSGRLAKHDLKLGDLHVACGRVHPWKTGLTHKFASWLLACFVGINVYPSRTSS